MTDKSEWKERLKQNLTLHLNGGNKFSELHYKITCDGVETGITRHICTNGSPKYLVQADELHFGEETFDMKKDGDPLPWIIERLPE